MRVISSTSRDIAAEIGEGRFREDLFHRLSVVPIRIPSLAERREETKTPIVQLFRKHWALVVIAAFVFAGNNAAGYMSTGGYIQNYATNPAGPLGLDRGPGGPAHRPGGRIAQ